MIRRTMRELVLISKGLMLDIDYGTSMIWDLGKVFTKLTLPPNILGQPLAADSSTRESWSGGNSLEYWN
jgi:hypothetical protein